MTYRSPAPAEPCEPDEPLPPGLRPSWRSWPAGALLLGGVGALLLPAAAALSLLVVLLASCALVLLERAAGWLGERAPPDVPPPAVLAGYVVLLLAAGAWAVTRPGATRSLPAHAAHSLSDRLGGVALGAVVERLRR